MEIGRPPISIFEPHPGHLSAMTARIGIGYSSNLYSNHASLKRFHISLRGKAISLAPRSRANPIVKSSISIKPARCISGSIVTNCSSRVEPSFPAVTKRYLPGSSTNSRLPSSESGPPAMKTKSSEVQDVRPLESGGHSS